MPPSASATASGVIHPGATNSASGCFTAKPMPTAIASAARIQSGTVMISGRVVGVARRRRGRCRACRQKAMNTTRNM